MAVVDIFGSFVSYIFLKNPPMITVLAGFPIWYVYCTYDSLASLFGCDTNFCQNLPYQFHPYLVALLFCFIQDYACCSQISLLFVSIVVIVIWDVNSIWNFMFFF